ncbi:MAG: nicotinate phosphoribosyltransferase [Chitinophagaceae bacterium]|nr:nicotinate phosphoribosyltransferase [Chitinophagaceae bacterium]
MNFTKDIYSTHLSLLTDLYQLTMAYSYWKLKKQNQKAVFHLFFRQNPFKNGYTVACGLEYVVNYLNSFKFSEDDLQYLAGLKSSYGNYLFEDLFLKYLSNMKFSCDVDAIAEGTVVFPHEPLVRVCGPILECQLLETPLLNIINYQTLIATKASRIYLSAGGDTIMEFGLRRAHGIDGALSASRAAFIGGTDNTSNVLAAKLFGIPVSGTHSHSWVMSFDTEIESFRAFAETMPHNCILLVDTYDTIKGVKNAIQVGLEMEKKSKKLLGIRIDSGDLAYFSQRAREMLDKNKLHYVKIIASNDLDEHIITSLKAQNAKVDIWGIGTKLITAFDQPALGGVYKLSSIEVNGKWNNRIKLSEQVIKMNNPGIQQVRRFAYKNEYTTDMIYNIQNEKMTNIIIDPVDPTRQKKLSVSSLEYEDLLKPIFREGKQVYAIPSIYDIKKYHQEQISHFDSSIKRLTNPHIYPVGLEKELYKSKTDLILKLRGNKRTYKKDTP